MQRNDLISEYRNHNYFKSAVGFFSFFSSTNVETKNVCPIACNLLLPIYYFANPAGWDGIDETTHNPHAHDARGHVYARSMCDFDDYWGDR
jgi:hypothetical protein